ncbi:MAG: nuclear transport factor 2 family protein, partial [Actinomycetota bacterium]|nr:nuclear transport factor 2 family protein [Actinomycetota bacterium]
TDDKIMVAETIYLYATGIDTKDFDLYRSIFADHVEIDFSSYEGSSVPEPDFLTVDQWVNRIKPLFIGLAATQHSMTNPVIALDGDFASCRMYMQAHHVFEPDKEDSWFTIGGFYDDKLVRDDQSPSGWKLTGVTLTVLWRKGNDSIMPEARAKGKQLLSN